MSVFYLKGDEFPNPLTLVVDELNVLDDVTSEEQVITTAAMLFLPLSVP